MKEGAHNKVLVTLEFYEETIIKWLTYYSHKLEEFIQHNIFTSNEESSTFFSHRLYL